jgi:hypothetical protein
MWSSSTPSYDAERFEHAMLAVDWQGVMVRARVLRQAKGDDPGSTLDITGLVRGSALPARRKDKPWDEIRLPNCDAAQGWRMNLI